jgi:hypothetical protein
VIEPILAFGVPIQLDVLVWTMILFLAGRRIMRRVGGE